MARVLEAKLNLSTGQAMRSAKELTRELGKTGEASSGAGKLGMASYLKLGAAIAATTKFVIELNATEARASADRQRRADAELARIKQRAGEELSEANQRLAGLRNFGDSPAAAAAFGRRGAAQFPGVGPERFNEIAFAPIAGGGRGAMQDPDVRTSIEQAARFAQAFPGPGAGMLTDTLRKFFDMTTNEEVLRGQGIVAGAADISTAIDVPALSSILKRGAPSYPGISLPRMAALGTAVGTFGGEPRLARAIMKRISQVPGRALGSKKGQAFVAKALQDSGFSPESVDPIEIAFALGDYINKSTSPRDRIARKNQLMAELDLTNEFVTDIELAVRPSFRKTYKEALESSFSPEYIREKALQNATEAQRLEAAEAGAGAPGFDVPVRGGFAESSGMVKTAGLKAKASLSREQYARLRAEFRVGDESEGFMNLTQDKGLKEDELQMLLGLNRLYPDLIGGLRDFLDLGNASHWTNDQWKANWLWAALKAAHDSANDKFEWVGTQAEEIRTYMMATEDAIRFLRSHGRGPATGAEIDAGAEPSGRGKMFGDDPLPGQAGRRGGHPFRGPASAAPLSAGSAGAGAGTTIVNPGTVIINQDGKVRSDGGSPRTGGK